MAKGLRVRTQVNVGGPSFQHSEANGLRVPTQVKGGAVSLNHSQAKGLRVRTSPPEFAGRQAPSSMSGSGTSATE